MDFKSIVFRELLEDEYFIQWLIAPDQESDKYWQAWMVNNPDKAAVLRDIKAVVNAIEPKHIHQLDSDEKADILGHVRQYAGQKKRQEMLWSTKPKRKRWGNWGLMAACFVILAILTANFFGVFEPEMATPELTKERMVVKQTSKGTKSSFYLPDGTLVKLNSSSSLEFPIAFTDSLRQVKLIGQAFFEVTRNEAAPFIVETDHMDVQVLGTSFDVLNDAEGKRFEVAVASGKVKVNSYAGNQEILAKTEMTRLDVSSGQLIKSHFDPTYQLGWKDGILAFEDESFEAVFGRLEDWYGVAISVDPALTIDKSYTGKYDNQSLENVLTGMSSVLGFQFKINGKQVTISL
ncbi:hypothetical protein DN752_16500 [Echinicola strongylocentroti]|uniref:FecR family protein n=1 Tax=Echinicola strongylocentroti TaxID=1795355 RepID=A0A2Z4IMH8_9BACT|nr:FecR domain-containing protein [Echinicola strongylocentroti]AWW31593.1 hypothetical protein DN752_16500 [Echinicola strongylocentroti]